jgi:hypothetical protein
MDLMGTLGLDKVEDPDNLPDGKYAGVIFKCEYIISKAGNLGIAITYKCTDPASKYNGREKFEWWGIGEGGTKDDAGEYHITKATMTEQQKPWFNKRMAAIGIPESRLSNLTDEDLKGRVGLEVVFGIANKNGYNNVNFLDVRSQQAGAVDPFTTATPAATQSPVAPAGGNLADQI